VKYIVLFIALLVSLFVSYENARFVIEDDEMVVITQFGKLVGETHKAPGEYFKIPFIQQTHYFKKYVMLLDDAQEVPTLDKKYLTLNTKIQWKISDPVAFYRNLNSSALARNFVSGEVGKAIRQIVTTHKSDDEIFQVRKSNVDGSSFCPLLEYEIKQTAEDDISKFGLHLIYVRVDISHKKDSKNS
jgi:regulator of protease activity HflC (stomatin/prohibitin superfamily)